MGKTTKTEIPGDDILFQEINEELKREKVKNFWNKYGILLTIVIIAILALAVSFESIKAWQDQKAQTRAEAYVHAYNLLIQGKYDESIAVFKDLEKQGSGIYKSIAQMQIADVLLEQGKKEEALNILSTLADTPDAGESLQNMAIFKLASYKLESAPAAETEALLKRLGSAGGSWSNIAEEMSAMLAIREGNINKAIDIYNNLLNNHDLPETLKNRVQDMVSVLTDVQQN